MRVAGSDELPGLATALKLAWMLVTCYGAAMLSADQIRDVFDASPDGILVVDHEGLIRDVNAGAATMFGWDREELLGQCVDVLVPPEQRSRHLVHRADLRARAPRPCNGDRAKAIRRP